LEVLERYKALLLKFTPDTLLYEYIHIRYQFNELIPLLSKACLLLNSNFWPSEFYEKLKNSIPLKKSESEDTDKDKGKSGDEESGDLSDKEKSEDEKSGKSTDGGKGKVDQMDIDGIKFLFREIDQALKDLQSKNDRLFEFLMEKANLQELLNAKTGDPKGFKAVIDKVNKRLCLDGPECMANFDVGQLSMYLFRHISLSAFPVKELGDNVDKLRQAGDFNNTEFNIENYIQRILNVLESYSAVLEKAEVDKELFNNLHIRFQFNELIPLLSAALLELDKNNLPKGFYEKLENAIEGKDESKKKDVGITNDENQGGTKDQDEGKQGGKGQNKTPWSLKLKIFLVCVFALVLIVVVDIIIYFVRRR
jgi:hypothetical protein